MSRSFNVLDRCGNNPLKLVSGKKIDRFILLIKLLCGRNRLLVLLTPVNLLGPHKRYIAHVINFRDTLLITIGIIENEIEPHRTIALLDHSFISPIPDLNRITRL